LPGLDHKRAQRLCRSSTSEATPLSPVLVLVLVSVLVLFLTLALSPKYKVLSTSTSTRTSTNTSTSAGTGTSTSTSTCTTALERQFLTSSLHDEPLSPNRVLQDLCLMRRSNLPPAFNRLFHLLQKVSPYSAQGPRQMHTWRSSGVVLLHQYFTMAGHVAKGSKVFEARHARARSRL
jgi:hypothetical protein